MSPYEKAITRLEATGSRRQGNNWNCPAHDDQHPSLSVNEGWDGTVLMWCHAGCTIAEVTAAIGLTPADLFPNGGRQMQLFPSSKYSPVGLDILLKLPHGAERSFIVTSALGRFVPSTGGRERVRRQEHIAAVIVETRHRAAAIRELGISRKAFSNDTIKWQEWGVAHKCSTRVLTILVRDSRDCPICTSRVCPLADGQSEPESPLADGQTASDSPLVDGQIVPNPATTRSRFFKELEVAWENRYPEGDGSPVREAVK